jgi:NhaA family Na+:H+ antiporter
VKLGFADAPRYASWPQIYGTALLCGIGFTMSLFIGLLAFPGAADLQDQVKIGVLAGSFLSGVLGAVILYFASPDLAAVEERART